MLVLAEAVKNSNIATENYWKIDEKPDSIVLVVFQHQHFGPTHGKG
jgi:hypothetical protein